MQEEGEQEEDHIIGLVIQPSTHLELSGENL